MQKLKDLRREFGPFIEPGAYKETVGSASHNFSEPSTPAYRGEAECFSHLF